MEPGAVHESEDLARALGVGGEWGRGGGPWGGLGPPSESLATQGLDDRDTVIRQQELCVVSAAHDIWTTLAALIGANINNGLSEGGPDRAPCFTVQTAAGPMDTTAPLVAALTIEERNHLAWRALSLQSPASGQVFLFRLKATFVQHVLDMMQRLQDRHADPPASIMGRVDCFEMGLGF